MKNYEEKEKRLNDMLNKLSLMSTRISPINNSSVDLNLQKNQLISEKEEVEKKYEALLGEHQNLKRQFEKIKAEIEAKLDSQNRVNDKIDELNQETEGLIGEIDKW